MTQVHTILMGSPRLKGTCAQVAQTTADYVQQRFPEDTVHTLALPDLQVAPCVGCNACQADGTCVIDDDMQAVRARLDTSDHLVVVAPIYFAGPPAQLKAVLDRLQPYFYHPAPAPKRPATLVAIGEGGDPHGYDPLVVCVRSALANAGFRLDHVLSAIGKSAQQSAEAVVAQLDDIFASSEEA